MKKFKLTSKGLKSYFSMLSAGLVVSFPSFAMAATSPESKLKKAFDSITDLIIGISIAAGVCVLAFWLFNLFFAGESHKRSEIIGHIKTTVVVTGAIPLATILINWVAGLFA